MTRRGKLRTGSGTPPSGPSKVFATTSYILTCASYTTLIGWKTESIAGCEPVTDAAGPVVGIFAAFPFIVNGVGKGA